MPMSERTFGVEIECISPVSQREVHAALTAGGIKCYWHGVDYGNDFNIHESWMIKEDGSIRESDGCPYLMEIITRVLKGDEGLEEIRKACKILRDLGVTVNKTCGLHVHQGASDFSAKDLINLVTRYGRNEQKIDSWIMSGRRGNQNHFCARVGSMVGWFNQPGRTAASLENLVSGVSNNFHTKYWAVNPLAFLYHGTIEFRQHGGTVDGEKICNWVRFLNAFMESSKGKMEETSIFEPEEYTEMETQMIRNPAFDTAYQEYALVARIHHAWAARREDFEVNQRARQREFELANPRASGSVNIPSYVGRNSMARKYVKLAEILNGRDRNRPLSATLIAQEIGIGENSVGSYISNFRNRYGCQVGNSYGRGYYSDNLSQDFSLMVSQQERFEFLSNSPAQPQFVPEVFSEPEPPTSTYPTVDRYLQQEVGVTRIRQRLVGTTTALVHNPELNIFTGVDPGVKGYFQERATELDNGSSRY